MVRRYRTGPATAAGPLRLYIWSVLFAAIRSLHLAWALPLGDDDSTGYSRKAFRRMGYGHTRWRSPGQARAGAGAGRGVRAGEAARIRVAPLRRPKNETINNNKYVHDRPVPLPCCNPSFLLVRGDFVRLSPENGWGSGGRGKVARQRSGSLVPLLVPGVACGMLFPLASP